MADSDLRPPHEERDDDLFAIRVKVQPEQAENLVRRGDFDFGDHPHLTPNPDGSSSLNLFVPKTQIEALEREGYEVEVVSNQSARARERLAEVGQGDRFEGGKVAPRGIGRLIGGAGAPNDRE
jgi:FMN phosphatase YigB (HAD superfamily)